MASKSVAIYIDVCNSLLTGQLQESLSYEEMLQIGDDIGPAIAQTVTSNDIMAAGFMMGSAAAVQGLADCDKPSGSTADRCHGALPQMSRSVGSKLIVLSCNQSAW